MNDQLPFSKFIFSELFLFFVMAILCSLPVTAQTVNPRKEYVVVLQQLTKTLLEKQLPDSAGGDAGALTCSFDHVLHTRAAEVMFPFAVMYSISGQQSYLTGSVRAGNWLIRQQQPNGSWKETPEEWTGTTTDQLLMLLLTYEKLSARLSAAEKQGWTVAMQKAADYLYQVMTPEFASINYVATTTATLAKAAQVLNRPAYMERAKVLAHRVISKMDEDGFLNGEGGRSHGNKSGTDVGYSMEMSLWGLGYYARLNSDHLVDRYVKQSLATHLYFIYPDGSMDNSWGIRSNKWTAYGGATSDGCQILFSLYANEDPRYLAASLQNLKFLEKNIQHGLVGYGPQHWEIFHAEPCIYPSFTKAKNLALAYELEQQATRITAPFPAQLTGWMKWFHTVNVAQVRTKKLMATVTAYGYKDYAAGAKSKYMYRPSGGAVSNLWLQGYGYLQASSPTVYSRPEPMSFPEAPGSLCLTSRLEYTDSSGYFTNLFEFDAPLTATGNDQQHRYTITASGDLKDKNWLSGGVGYRLHYTFSDTELVKKVTLLFHDARPVVQIIEPFIQRQGCTFTAVDDTTVLINTGHQRIRFRILRGSARLLMGEKAAQYYTPYPALKAFPVTLEVTPPRDGFEQSVVYAITVLP